MDPNEQIEMMKKLIGPKGSSGCFHQSFCIGADSHIDTVRLWDGILLWANEIKLTRLTYPADIFGENDYLLVNICHLGRCEVELQPGNYVYMSPGILNVSASAPRSSYYYPGGRYGGIELCFDMKFLRSKMPDALTAYGFGYSTLERYAAKENMLAALTNAGMQEEEQLFRMIRGMKTELPDLRFAALSLLYHLANGEAAEIGDSVLISKGQRRIVTEAEQVMTADLRKRYTLDEMAARFGISASALKKYFSAVYGRPVCQYMREKRMQKARELLVETDANIGEIAAACGYEHQGKFGTAFKAFSGSSPLEYRRLNRRLKEVT